MTAKIDHENNDCGEIHLIGYSSTVGGTLSSDCLACNSMCFKDEKREKLVFEVVMSE